MKTTTKRFKMLNQIKEGRKIAAKQMLDKFICKGELLVKLNKIAKEGYYIENGNLITLVNSSKLKRNISFCKI
tara:strand:+ start:150 stop:368 length:219 start_codon:yes stop_codon:yes gene_type:complete